MKTSNPFQNTIKVYLDQRAETDVLFAFQYSKPDKNIDDCITYILNYVQQSGICGFSDDEIYSLALHYYDEESIEVGKPINCNVVVNHTIILTDEEKAEARQQAIKRAENEAYAKLKQQQEKAFAKRTKAEVTPQPSLFDFKP